MSRRMSRPVIWSRRLGLVVLWLVSLTVQGQDFDFQVPASVESAQTPAQMQDLAQRILPVFEDKDPERYFAYLGALQLVSGNLAGAQETRASLRERRKGADARLNEPRVLFHDLYTQAREREAKDRLSFHEAYRRVFRERVSRLDDRSAFALGSLLSMAPAISREVLQDAFDRARNQPRVSMAQAVDLVWKYLAYDAYRSFAPVIAELEAEDQARRYQVEPAVRIAVARGVELHAHVVRPRAASGPVPALLEFTIYAGGEDEALASAAQGYAGVLVYARGLHGSGGRLQPFRQEAEDARAVIRWIQRQPWSDGRVGMFGTRYSAFTAWAAARQRPEALRAIAVVDPMAPGIDFPREGGVMHNGALRWLQEFAPAAPSAATPRDEAAWQALDRRWFQSGRPYRDLDRLAGLRSEPFRLWLAHPSYDRWWQRMIPFGSRFSTLDLPVLSVLRDVTARDSGALYYFREHLAHRAQADQRLLAGVRDQRAESDRLAGFERRTDADAEDAVPVDLRALRYAFFDQVFRNAPRPALLKDRVNVALTGASREWRHAPSLDALTTAGLRLHLDTGPVRAGAAAPRALRRKAVDGSFEQVVELGRKRAPTPAVIRYVSEPFAEPQDLVGLMRGRLDFRPSRMDVDVVVTLFEQLATGEQRPVAAPYVFRASYARARTQRQLLQAGVRQSLEFEVERLLGRRLAAGSRLVLELGVNRRADMQVNLGGGAEVSTESAQTVPGALKIRWYGGSYVDLPLRRVAAPTEQP